MNVRIFTNSLFVLLLIFNLTSQAGTISKEYSFTRPVIEKIVIENDIYDRLIMENTPNGGNPGQPALPVMGARLLIPYNCSVTDIDVTAESNEFLGNNYKIEPVGEPVPFSQSNTNSHPPTPDSIIYNTNGVYPEFNFEIIGQQNFRGYQILILKLLPVQYNPVTGELYYFPRLTISVDYIENGKNSQLFRNLNDDDLEILNRVDNQEQIESYRTGDNNNSKSFDLLIITTSLFVNSFLPLKDYHDSNGIITEIHTMENIGSNDPDVVRDYIRDIYQADGISYVLIGGDDDIIPAKDLFVYTWETGTVVYDMPGDIYFACLDGTYNFDGDNKWGEFDDGEGGGDVDLIAEVYVGRAPVGDTVEVRRFVDKTISYLNYQNSAIDKVLLVGEQLGFGGLGEFGGYSMDELVGEVSTYGYTTTGIPSGHFAIDKLYDMNETWSCNDIANRINTGYHIIDHLGHSNVNYAMKLTSTQVINLLNNEDLCFVYSQGCLAGHFDNMDCWAETMTIKTDNGAFATINNARYGLGGFYSADGASQRYNREFWDAVFRPSEGKPEIGRANHDSKEDNLYRINEAGMRWLYYGITLFGDPTVPILNLISLEFEYSSNIPEVVLPGQMITMGVMVRGLSGGVPVPGTGKFHYIINDGAMQTIDMTETAPNEYEVSIPALACGENMKCYFSATEASRGPVIDPPVDDPYIIKSGLEMMTVFEDDFEADKGWSVSGGLWERGQPAGQGGNAYTGPDPSSGHSGENVFGYNLYGNYENSLGEMHLTSPSINCSMLVNTHLKFWRWHGVEAPPFDHSYIRASNNGVDWVDIWEHPSEVWDIEWNYMDLDISAVADGQSTVYLRWTMGPTNSSLVYFGWNIDDVELTGHLCDSNWLIITTSSLPDWTAGYPYSKQLEAFGNTAGIFWADKYNDLENTGLILSSGGLLSGTVDSAQDISFVAIVSNEKKSTYEKEFSFTVNQKLNIESDTLPNGIVDEPFTCQLISSGGTGEINWIDKNGDLNGIGLSLSSDGYLSGIVSEESQIMFIAEIFDIIGAFTEKQFSLEIQSGFICGDINNDDTINILDITYLITYLYRDGPAPVSMWAADPDGNDLVNILDITYLIAYLYMGGPEPVCL